MVIYMTIMSPTKRKRLPGEITAAEFKAKCLELMDLVHENHGEIIITKRGKPVAKLGPVVKTPARLFGALRGSVKILGDIVSPVGEPWTADR